MPPDAPAPRALLSTYEGLMALITGRGSGPAPDALVLGDARASADERVHVYEHMYRARMVEALEAQFPRLARWLGAEAFAELAFAYVRDRPSRHPSLRFIGRHLPAWLAERAGEQAPHPALADLARLEWARADVFDAGDEPTLALDALRAWPIEQFAALPLQLIGAHRLLTVAQPIAALWDAIGAGDGTGTDAETAADAITLAEAANPQGQSLLIWRQGVSVFHRAVDEGERAALEEVAAGTTFGVVCEALLEQRAAEQATAQAFAWLSTWTADELLVAPAAAKRP